MYVTIDNTFQSFYSIKQDIIRKTKKECFLFYGNSILEDNKTPYEYNIKKNSKIQVVFKKKGGATVSEGLEIFGCVILFLIYFFFLAIGLIPFISFIVSNILTFALKKSVGFLRDLTDPNNWINSFLHVIQTIIIPFIQFVLDYFGLFIFSFFLTFFCTYKLYYFKNKGSESVKNTCKAFKSANNLSIINSILIVMFYFLANLPLLLSNIAVNFVGPLLKKPMHKFVEKLAEIRIKFLMFSAPNAQVAQAFIDSAKNAFIRLNQLKAKEKEFLYNWAQTYKMTKIYPMNLKIKELGLEEILKYINFAESESQGVKDKEILCFDVTKSAKAYFLRSVLDNILYILLKFVNILDICGSQNATIVDLENQKNQLQEMLSMLEKNKNNKKLNTFLQLEEQITKLKQFINQAKNSKLLNVPCLVNILTNGAMFSAFITILFFILFIVFFFVNI